MKKQILQTSFFCLSLLLLFAVGQVQAQIKATDYIANWPEWRGFNQTGASVTSNPPIEFSETSNVKWKIEIPGKGHATPIVWGNQIIVQTAVPTDIKVAKDASAPSPMSPTQTDLVHKFTVISIDKITGKTNWQTIVDEEVPAERTHELGSWASNSPCTDGENIYAFFGSRGLFCLDMKGNVKWKRNFGVMDIVASFGEGSSPSVYKDKIFIQWDHQGKSFMYALNKKTGEDVWKVERDEKTSWTTPLVIEVNGKPQVITSATNKVRSYDFETGAIIWEYKGLSRNVIPNPTYADGILYVMSGYQGNALKAIDLAKANGDITGTAAVLWEYNQDTPYTPSPLLMGGRLYFLKGNKGILTCLNAKDGKVIYSNQKLDGISDIFSSPTGSKDQIYIAAVGVVDVVKAGSEFALLAKNTLDDTFEASPVVVGNDLFLRGYKYLYCISKK